MGLRTKTKRRGARYIIYGYQTSDSFTKET